MKSKDKGNPVFGIVLYHIGDLYWVAKLGNVFGLGTSIICISGLHYPHSMASAIPDSHKAPPPGPKAPINGKDAIGGNNNGKFMMFGIYKNFSHICNGK